MLRMRRSNQSTIEVPTSTSRGVFPSVKSSISGKKESEHYAEMSVDFMSLPPSRYPAPISLISQSNSSFLLLTT